jgi:uncharacterized membrane protein YphA (DoxX/SURF4 family)
MKFAIWSARVLLAAVFLYAGIMKLGTSEQFAITIAQFFILPKAWSALFAVSLACFEILVGILLLIPRTAQGAAFVSAALLITFIATLTWAWSQGFTVGCGCFGPTEDEPAPGNQIPLAIARDVVLLALTLLLAARRSTLQRSAGQPPH